MTSQHNIGDQVRQRTLEYYSLVDSGDVTGILDWFTHDAEYRRPGYAPMRGTEELETFYSGARVIESGRHTVDALIVEAEHSDPEHSGGSVAVRGRFTGRLKDGTDVEVGFADFIDYRREDDGALRALLRITYFDSPAV